MVTIDHRLGLRGAGNAGLGHELPHPSDRAASARRRRRGEARRGPAGAGRAPPRGCASPRASCGASCRPCARPTRPRSRVRSAARCVDSLDLRVSLQPQLDELRGAGARAGSRASGAAAFAAPRTAPRRRRPGRRRRPRTTSRRAVPSSTFINTVASTLHSIRSESRRRVRAANSAGSLVRTNRMTAPTRAPAVLVRPGGGRRRIVAPGHLALDRVGQSALGGGDGVVAGGRGSRGGLASPACVSACAVSACAVSACAVSACAVSACAVSACAVSACAVSACAVSVCAVSVCAVSACAVVGLCGVRLRVSAPRALPAQHDPDHHDREARAHDDERDLTDRRRAPLRSPPPAAEALEEKRELDRGQPCAPLGAGPFPAAHLRLRRCDSGGELQIGHAGSPVASGVRAAQDEPTQGTRAAHDARADRHDLSGLDLHNATNELGCANRVVSGMWSVQDAPRSPGSRPFVA